MKKLQLLLVIISPVILNAQIIPSSKKDEDRIFEKIEIEASFKGGFVKWIEFVKKNFNFSRIENSFPDSVEHFSDTAKIQFIIDKNGLIKDIRFLTRNSSSFQQSCIEVYKDSPHWNPA